MTKQTRDWLIVGLNKVAPRITPQAIEEYIALKREIDELYSRGYTMGRNFGKNSRGRAIDTRYNKQQIILDRYR